MAEESDDVRQINIRLRMSTRDRLEASARADRRSMGDQADVLIVEALEIREMGLDPTAMRIAKSLAKRERRTPRSQETD